MIICHLCHKALNKTDPTKQINLSYTNGKKSSALLCASHMPPFDLDKLTEGIHKSWDIGLNTWANDEQKEKYWKEHSSYKVESAI